jgi:hypothetical protein
MPAVMVDLTGAGGLGGGGAGFGDLSVKAGCLNIVVIYTFGLK